MTATIVIALRILAVALLGAAVYFYTQGEQDWIFASLVLAACSYFFSLRFLFRSGLADQHAEHEETISESESE